jgi:AraC-like DNA-binding protein
MSETAGLHPPRPELADLVDAFWTQIDPGEVRVIPDGCVDLIFHWRRDRRDGGILDSHLFVAGVMTAPELVTVEPHSCLVGMRCRPGMSRPLIASDPCELAGRNVAAAELDPRLASLSDALAEAAIASPDRMVSIFQAKMHDLASSHSTHRPPLRVRQALFHLGRSGRIEQTAEKLGISPRSLHRDLREWSGLPPKSLARILRLQAAMARLRDQASLPLAQVALACGYADQSHMTNEFRELAGLAPSAFRPSAGS